MELLKALNDKKFDLRIRDRKVEEGLVSKGEVDNYLDELVDDSDHFTLISVDDNVKKRRSVE